MIFSPSSVHSDLHVVVRVEVRVEQHHSVGSGEVDALPPGARGQQEDIHLGARRVECLDPLLPVLATCRFKLKAAVSKSCTQ